MIKFFIQEKETSSFEVPQKIEQFENPVAPDDFGTIKNGQTSRRQFGIFGWRCGYVSKIMTGNGIWVHQKGCLPPKMGR